ncbi:hypothetical protein FG386_002571 [Cryptosporidium ryanae]|uniref:uncharacterized protein n=1 Tax=Cryptosporidium ryanae TaxID=515981 RepID=UPI00351A6F39|nr:hypothetical protein FG386_002571 [Cryptosporidium ryanae]
MDKFVQNLFLFINYKELIQEYLDIPSWEQINSGETHYIIEKKIKFIQNKILLNEETEYWRFEQTLCILLRLSTFINPYKNIRNVISKYWNKLYNELLSKWGSFERKRIVIHQKQVENETSFYNSPIKNVPYEYLFKITLGGTSMDLNKAIEIFVNDKVEFPLPCGRFMCPEFMIPGTPGFDVFQNKDEDDVFWKNVFNTFYGRIPSIFRLIYILPEYAKSLLNSYKIIMESRKYGVLPIFYRHFIGILSSSLYDNDYIVKLEIQMFLINNGPIEWLKNPLNVLPDKFFVLFEYLKSVTFEPNCISNDLLRKLIGTSLNTQVWTITELSHIICIVTTIQSMCQLSCSFGITSMDHWELGPDPLEGVNCDGNTCYDPTGKNLKDCIEYKKGLDPKYDDNTSNCLETSYYKEILSDYIDVSNEEGRQESHLVTNQGNQDFLVNDSTAHRNVLGVINSQEIHIIKSIKILTALFSTKANVIQSSIPFKEFVHSKIDKFKFVLTGFFNFDHLTSKNSSPEFQKNEEKVPSPEFSQNKLKERKRKNKKGIKEHLVDEENFKDEDSTLIRIVHLLNRFPQNGDILSMNKSDAVTLRSNSDRHKADRLLLSSVMNSKPIFKTTSMSTNFKRLSDKSGQLFNFNEHYSNSVYNLAGNRKEKMGNVKEKSNNQVSDKKNIVSKNDNLTCIINSFSIQMSDHEFYSEIIWSILSTYSKECSSCIKNEFDILLFECSKKIKTICDIFEVPTTNPIRSSIWSYAFKLCGITKFEMIEFVHNSFLPLELKVLLKKTICNPQSILRSDFERCRIIFSYTELIYYLIVVCKAKQAVTITCTIQSISNLIRDTVNNF